MAKPIARRSLTHTAYSPLLLMWLVSLHCVLSSPVQGSTCPVDVVQVARVGFFCREAETSS